MMQGRVNQNCEMLAIVIRNNAITQLVDTVINTGVSGFLTLPADIISALGLSWEGRDFATLGDGTACTFDVYLGLVIWDGQYREVYINESETIPLIGMKLLRGYDLQIQAIEGGLVIIKELSGVI
jgi:clan AA aspartic protease